MCIVGVKFVRTRADKDMLSLSLLLSLSLFSLLSVFQSLSLARVPSLCLS